MKRWGNPAFAGSPDLKLLWVKKKNSMFDEESFEMMWDKWEKNLDELSEEDLEEWKDEFLEWVEKEMDERRDHEDED